MGKKFIWLVVSCLAVLVLLAAGCAPAPEKEVAPGAPAVKEVAPAAKEVAPAVKEVAPAEKPGMVKLTLTKLDGTTMEKLVQKPQYGGTFTVSHAGIVGFDPTLVPNWNCTTAHVTNDKLGMGDFYRSQSGTFESSFLTTVFYDWKFIVPHLAERWEIPDNQTIIYYLRKGVRFQDKPPANGREMTANDVVFSIKRHYELPASYVSTAVAVEEHPASVRAIDNYTVEVKSKPGVLIHKVHQTIVAYVFIYPPEVFTRYGDLADWRNAVGTGAYILTDNVPMSSVVLKRNPNWFKNDPLFPENRLPYPDAVQIMIISDPSTLEAAFRAGKLDLLSPANVDSFLSLRKNLPEMKWGSGYTCSPAQLHIRLDRPELPWAPQDDANARKVRYAMNMAIDRKSVVENLFKGYGAELCWPVLPLTEWSDIWYKFEELPPHIQEIYTYNPQKAKQLLAEAGYPDGFKMKIDTGPGIRGVDMAIVYKEYWEAIGIQVELKVSERVAALAMEMGRTHEQAIYSGTAMTDLWGMWSFDPLQDRNRSMVNDPIINGWLADFKALVVDEPARRKLMREKFIPYVLEKAYYVTPPAPMAFRVMQPWLNNYYGESGYGDGQYNSWWSYVWIDQELKKAKLR